MFMRRQQQSVALLPDRSCVWTCPVHEAARLRALARGPAAGAPRGCYRVTPTCLASGHAGRIASRLRVLAGGCDHRTAAGASMTAPMHLGRQHRGRRHVGGGGGGGLHVHAADEGGRGVAAAGGAHAQVQRHKRGRAGGVHTHGRACVVEWGELQVRDGEGRKSRMCAGAAPIRGSCRAGLQGVAEQAVPAVAHNRRTLTCKVECVAQPPRHHAEGVGCGMEGAPLRLVSG